MFPTGSKLFYGLTALAAVALLVYGLTQSWGALGSIGLASVTVALAFLGGMSSFTRDCNVSSMDDTAVATAASAQRVSHSSLWPVVGALGAGLVAVGLITDSRFFVAGFALIGAAIVEWMVQGWAERASGDREFNASIRRRVAYPLELPLLGAAGLGLLIFSFSRIMLAADKEVGTALFIIVGAVVLMFGFVFAAFPHLRKAMTGTVLAVGAVLLLAAGIASAVRGERPELAEHGEALSEKACGAEEGESDHHAPGSLSAKANVAAIVTLTENGLVAEQRGVTPVLNFQRSNPTNIVFRNKTSEERRLLVLAGSEAIDVGGESVLRPIEYCTYLIGEDQENLVTVTFPKSSLYGDGEFYAEVPGVEGARVEIVVP